MLVGAVVSENAKWKNVLVNFLVVLAGVLAVNFGVTQAFPTIEALYGAVLSAIVTTGAIHGINTVQAKKKEKENGT